MCEKNTYAYNLKKILCPKITGVIYKEYRNYLRLNYLKKKLLF